MKAHYSRKTFYLQEREQKEKVAARVEAIMSRNVTQLNYIAQHLHKLKQKQIHRALKGAVKADEE